MDAIVDFFRVYQTTIGVIGINALLALSVWVTLYAGQLTLGNAAFMAVGAYGAALLGMRFGVPFPVGLALGALLSAALELCPSSSGVSTRSVTPVNRGRLSEHSGKRASGTSRQMLRWNVHCPGDWSKSQPTCPSRHT